MTEAFSTRTVWTDHGSVIIHLVNTHGVDVYTLQLGEDTVKVMMKKQQPRCESTIAVVEVEDDKHRSAVYVNSYGDRAPRIQDIRCENRADHHVRHTGAMVLPAIGDRRPDATQPTAIRIFW